MASTFQKYHGAGNDFILIDNRSGYFHPDKNVIQKMCERRFGIGADGLMLLEKADEYDFSMRYYNSDGNESTMCGNGGRCIVAFARSLGLIDRQTFFLATDGPHLAKILDDGRISLKMQDVEEVRHHQGHDVINTGSPHYIVWVHDPGQVKVLYEGSAIRHDPDISNDGVNVNFVTMAENRHIHIRTYERGVEDETLACGTGSVAAAISAHFRSPSDKSSYIIHALGGDLEVEFREEATGIFRDVWLTGPTQWVFEGKWSSFPNNLSA